MSYSRLMTDTNGRDQMKEKGERQILKILRSFKYSFHYKFSGKTMNMVK